MLFIMAWKRGWAGMESKPMENKERLS